MSNYPDNMPSSRRCDATYRCVCGCNWAVDGIEDFGTWSPYDDADTICPICKKEGEFVE